MVVLLGQAAAGQPSAWVQRFAGLIRPGGRVIDVACGSGRNALWLAAQGFEVTGLDRDTAALDGLKGRIHDTVAADIEASPWPLPGRQFDAVVLANYLWRPLWPQLRAALAPGAVYLHETFADGQQHVGRPARPDFLLQRGELWKACEGLRIVAFEDGFEQGRFVQRIVAVNEAPSPAVPLRYPLHPGSGA